VRGGAGPGAPDRIVRLSQCGKCKGYLTLLGPRPQVGQGGVRGAWCPVVAWAPAGLLACRLGWQGAAASPPPPPRPTPLLPTPCVAPCAVACCCVATGTARARDCAFSLACSRAAQHFRILIPGRVLRAEAVCACVGAPLCPCVRVHVRVCACVCSACCAPRATKSTRCRRTAPSSCTAGCVTAAAWRSCLGVWLGLSTLRTDARVRPWRLCPRVRNCIRIAGLFA
jgi:hypothetical protein